MSSAKKLVILVISLIFITNLTLADWKEDAKAVKISGGEDHTLILTANKWLWGKNLLNKLFL